MESVFALLSPHQDFDPGEVTAPTRDSDATEADALSFLAELAVQVPW